ncbi:MAG TPA: LysM domain-containing protein [Methylocella sp.]
MDAPTRPSAETPPPGLVRYTIRADDSLRGIAVQFYGDARQWRRISTANPGLDPRRLRIGQEIKLPAALTR